MCRRERGQDPVYLLRGTSDGQRKAGNTPCNGKNNLKIQFAATRPCKGYQVNRKAGWDTHGLPVEIEVEKQLNMSGKQDIEKYGIKEFNQKCRESVFTYTGMWREMSREWAIWWIWIILTSLSKMIISRQAGGY